MVAGLTAVRSAALMMCALPILAWGQVLSDPTRPPMEVGGDGSSLTVMYSSPPATKGLLSVIISPSRCAAIIDGKTIKLGERYGDAILVEVTARDVELQSAHGSRRMELFPRVGVQASAALPESLQGAKCSLENRKNIRQSARQSGSKEKK